MFDKDIGEFVKKYHMLDDNMCNACVEELEKSSPELWHQHVFYNSITDSTRAISGERELDISNDALPEFFHIGIMKQLAQTIQTYQEDINLKWWYNWNDYSHLRINRYEKNREMALHCDHIHSLFDGNSKGVPILSMLMSFNDDYEGGEFIMWDQEIKINKGEVLVFPSNFMYPHKVQPVTKGVRYTGISWVW